MHLGLTRSLQFTPQVRNHDSRQPLQIPPAHTRHGIIKRRARRLKSISPSMSYRAANISPLYPSLGACGFKTHCTQRFTSYHSICTRKRVAQGHFLCDSQEHHFLRTHTHTHTPPVILQTDTYISILFSLCHL